MLNLDKCCFRQGTFDLRAHWTLPHGSHLAVVGPSGSGKSTLLAGIAGFVDQTEGTTTWDGAVLALRPDARPVAMLFQDHNLFPHLNISQNVGLGLRPSLNLTAPEQMRIDEALAAVDLAGFGERKPAQLSGGQQSRAAIARIMVMDRPLILLDEPFSALGPAQRYGMLDLMQNVARQTGATLMMVTHDPNEAERLGGLVSFVDAGRAEAPVNAPDFFANPPEGMRRYTGG